MFDNQREDFLRAAEFKGCDRIPCSVVFSPATWHKYREKLEEVILDFPAIFGSYEKGSRNFDSFGPTYREGEYFTDNWGCVWYNVKGGMEGQVVKNPLANWDALASYRPPDPLTMTERGKREDWKIIESRILNAKRMGFLTWGSTQADIRFFERLHFLRGFTNLMRDFVTQSPNVQILIDLIIENNLKEIHKWLEIGVDVMGTGDDLGTQKSLMVNPKLFQKYLYPGYVRMFSPIRAKGTHVYFHSDGHILEVVDDLIKSGVTILNPQSRANGIDNIRKNCRGKVCISLDLDRQYILPYGSIQQVRNHVKEAVEKLGSREGGLMLYADIYPDVPLENIVALCQAMEDYRYY